jgi:sulfite reductase (NADPH) flavoprotein alpha-component
MANDVDNALKHIVAEEGGMSAEAAGEYVAKLVKEGRYQRDVY